MEEGEELKSLNIGNEAAPLTPGAAGISSPASASVTAQTGADLPPSTTPINYAAQNGDLQQVKDLISSGKASATDVAPDTTTALHWAAINNRYSICKYLIEMGAEVDKRGGELEATPLHWACRSGLVYIAHLLLKHGADPNALDSQGFNSLHLAVHSSNVLLVTYLVYARSLTDETVHIDAPDSSLRTPLHWAAYQGDSLTVHVLLHRGADVGAKDSLGFTPLHWAIVRGSKPCLVELIKEGADVFASNNDGKTAFTMAGEMNTWSIWKEALLESGRLENGWPRKIYLTPFQTDAIIFTVPFVSLPVVALCLVSFHPLLSIPLSAVIGYGAFQGVVRFVIPNKYHGKNILVRSPAFAGLFSASLFWVTLVFLNMFGTILSHAPFISLFFLIADCSATYAYVRCMTMDPGIVPPLQSDASQLSAINLLIEEGTFDTIHYCINNFTRKPLRSKYDRNTEKVIAKFDHYCPWTNNAVGLRTHKLFLVYVFSLFTGISLFIYAFYVYVSLNSVPETCKLAAWPELCTAWNSSPFSLLITVWAALQMTWISMLIIGQLSLISKGLTSNEAAQMQRHSSLTDIPFSTLPQDHENYNGKEIPASGLNSMPVKQRGPLGFLSQLLGIQQFTTTLRESFNESRIPWRRKNPYNYGVLRNCADFWNGGPFTVAEGGVSRLNGAVINYYTLYDLPNAPAV